MPRAADSGDAFGMSKPRFISVSMGPRKTAWTATPWPAKSARSDCIMLNAAAFEMEYLPPGMALIAIVTRSSRRSTP